MLTVSDLPGMELRILVVYLCCAITMAVWSAIIFHRQVRANCRCNRHAQIAADNFRGHPIRLAVVSAVRGLLWPVSLGGYLYRAWEGRHMPDCPACGQPNARARAMRSTR
jgi:hypothetical protein